MMPAALPRLRAPRGADTLAGMRIAHVRERHAPAGAPWRLAAALGPPARDAPAPGQWLDLEIARRRLVAEIPERAHNSPLFRAPIRTLDDHLAAGLRIAALGEIVEAFRPRGEDDEAVLDADDLAFGPPVLRPPSLRDFYAFEGHVATMWSRRGGEIPEAWFRLPVFYFSNVSEIRGPDEPVWAPRGSNELDFELEVCAVIDTPAHDLEASRAEEAIGGYCILDDWSARDLQREETTVRLGPAKGKDFASTIGPWIVTPDELTDARAPGATGPALAMTAEVTDEAGARHPISRGTWADAHFSFGDMLARASADVRLRPGDLVGSGTVGSGCLLEVKDATLGRYLAPGDTVTLAIERLGSLRTQIVARPA
jgi:fumarylacetoacetate (FAA) hydrolase